MEEKYALTQNCMQRRAELPWWEKAEIPTFHYKCMKFLSFNSVIITRPLSSVWHGAEGASFRFYKRPGSWRVHTRNKATFAKPAGLTSGPKRKRDWIIRCKWSHSCISSVAAAILWIPPITPHLKAALLETVETVWVQWTHCHVRGSRLSFVTRRVIEMEAAIGRWVQWGH